METYGAVLTIATDGSLCVKFNKETGRCSNLSPEGLCSLYQEGRPFGCIVAPVALNRVNTLIISNRFRLFKCRIREGADGGIPAYVAFRSSLDLFFGEEDSQRICNFLQGSDYDLEAWVDRLKFEDLKFTDSRYIATKRIRKKNI